MTPEQRAPDSLYSGHMKTLGERTHFVPESELDLVLCVAGTPVNVYYHHPVSGEIMAEEDNKEMRERCEKDIYTTTDHLPIRVGHKDVTAVYVSLDDSSRAVGAGYPLERRLVGICNMLNGILAYAGDRPTIVFFSEAGRTKKGDGFDWMTARRTLERLCDLEYIDMMRNNDDDMAFGLAAFKFKNGSVYQVQGVYGKQLLTRGFGSVTLGIEIKHHIYWAVHFPLSFGHPEFTGEACTRLIEVMKKYPNSAFAFGDFNPVEHLYEPIRDAVRASDDMMLHGRGDATFYGAHYDIVPVRK